MTVSYAQSIRVPRPSQAPQAHDCLLVAFAQQRHDAEVGYDILESTTFPLVVQLILQRP